MIALTIAVPIIIALIFGYKWENYKSKRKNDLILESIWTASGDPFNEESYAVIDEIRELDGETWISFEEFKNTKDGPISIGRKHMAYNKFYRIYKLINKDKI